MITHKFSELVSYGKLLICEAKAKIQEFNCGFPFLNQPLVCIWFIKIAFVHDCLYVCLPLRLLSLSMLVLKIAGIDMKKWQPNFMRLKTRVSISNI